MSARALLLLTLLATGARVEPVAFLGGRLTLDLPARGLDPTTLHPGDGQAVLQSEATVRGAWRVRFWDHGERLPPGTDDAAWLAAIGAQLDPKVKYRLEPAAGARVTLAVPAAFGESKVQAIGGDGWRTAALIFVALPDGVVRGEITCPPRGAKPPPVPAAARRALATLRPSAHGLPVSGVRHLGPLALVVPDGAVVFATARPDDFQLWPRRLFGTPGAYVTLSLRDRVRYWHEDLGNPFTATPGTLLGEPVEWHTSSMPFAGQPFTHTEAFAPLDGGRWLQAAFVTGGPDEPELRALVAALRLAP
jgi:hypothetical protein